MIADEEYRKIGKALIDEILMHGDERHISLTFRTMRLEGKLYIRIEDRPVPVSVWDHSALLAVNQVNVVQFKRKLAEEFRGRIEAKMGGRKLPKVAE